MTAAICMNSSRVDGKCGSTSCSNGLESVAIVQRTRCVCWSSVAGSMRLSVIAPASWVALGRHQVPAEGLLDEGMVDGGDVPE